MKKEDIEKIEEILDDMKDHQWVLRAAHYTGKDATALLNELAQIQEILDKYKDKE